MLVKFSEVSQLLAAERRGAHGSHAGGCLLPTDVTQPPAAGNSTKLTSEICGAEHNEQDYCK